MAAAVVGWVGGPLFPVRHIRMGVLGMAPMYLASAPQVCIIAIWILPHLRAYVFKND